MSLQILLIVLSALSVLAGLTAAILWFFSAVVPMPESFSIHVAKPDMGPLGGDPVGGTYVGHGYSPELTELANAFRRQSKLSGWAARLTALAVIFHAVALPIQISITRGQKTTASQCRQKT